MTTTDTAVEATTRRLTRSTSLARCVAVIGAVLAFNLVVYALGRAVSATFSYTHGGTVTRVDAAAVSLMSVLPLATGLALTALLSRRWPVLITIAKVVAPVLAVATIGATTIPAHFDTSSALCLSAMHLALIPAAVLALGACTPRRRLAPARPA
jgi:hypothetical protein